MQRFRLFSLFVLMPVLAALMVAGCAKKPPDDDEDEGPRRGGKGKGGPVAEKLTPLDVKAVGTVKGKVVYDGDPPGRTDIIAQVKQNKTDADHCMSDKSKDSFETAYWKVGADKGVADVVVFLRAPKGKAFPEDFVKKTVEKDSITVDQPYCAFEPHVSVLLPGQKLVIQNSAPLSHNTKFQGDAVKNPGDNYTLVAKMGDRPPDKREVTNLKPDTKTPIRLQCNIHTWMNGIVWASDTPLAAVTDKEGNFEIKNVPAGTELRLATWHEQPGYFGEGEREGKPITIKEGENVLPEIKIKAK
jgi:hypothetical protein